MNDPAPPKDTAKSLGRAVSLLKALSAPSSRGFPLSELSRTTGLPHPTAHRLLQHLVQMGLAVCDEESKFYALGPLTFELGLAAADQCDIRSMCGDSMDRLQEQSHDTCYLTMRSGRDAVCIDRREGTSPIRVFSLNVGSRRPLGVGAAGLAMLSRLPVEEAREMILAAKPRLLAYNRMSPSELNRLLDEARAEGYAACGNWVTLGVTAVAVPLCDSIGRPFGSLSISAVNARMPRKRWPLLANMLKEEADEIQQRLEGPARHWLKA